MSLKYECEYCNAEVYETGILANLVRIYQIYPKETLRYCKECFSKVADEILINKLREDNDKFCCYCKKQVFSLRNTVVCWFNYNRQMRRSIVFNNPYSDTAISVVYICEHCSEKQIGY